MVGSDRPPAWIAWLVPMMGGTAKVHIAAAAGVATVAIALVSGAAFYVASYWTERLGQCIGNDLRVRLYHHLQELSLAYYDTNRVGTILSTLTTDVQTIQSFASTSTLNILTDTLTLVAMVVVMLVLRWDFALIALAVTPVLIIFLVRVNKAIKVAVTEVRTRQSDLLATLQEGLQSIEVVQAYSREEYEDKKLQTVSSQTVDGVAQDATVIGAALTGGECGGRGVYRAGAVARRAGGPARRDDCGRTDGVPVLSGQVLPTGSHTVSDVEHFGPGVGRVPTGHRGLRCRRDDPRARRADRPAAAARRHRLRARHLLL